MPSLSRSRPRLTSLQSCREICCVLDRDDLVSRDPSRQGRREPSRLKARHTGRDHVWRCQRYERSWDKPLRSISRRELRACLGNGALRSGRGHFVSKTSGRRCTCGTGSRTPMLRSPWGAISRRVFPSVGATFYPGEGHLHFVDRLPEIRRSVSSSYWSIKTTGRPDWPTSGPPPHKPSAQFNRLVRSGVVRGKPLA